MSELCLLFMCIIMATAMGQPLSSEQSDPLPKEPSEIDKEKVPELGSNSNKNSLGKLMKTVGEVADMMSRYERIVRNKERELEQKRTDQKKQPVVPKKPEAVRNCSIVITTPISVQSYQVIEAAEKLSDTFPVPCSSMSKFLATQKKIAPFPDNFKSTNDEPRCAIHAFKLNEKRHKNIPCERLAELVNTYEPQPGRLNCTQANSFNKTADFTPCASAPTDKDSDASFTVLALHKDTAKATVPKISEKVILPSLPASGGSGNLTIEGSVAKELVDEFDFDLETLDEKAFNLNLTLNAATLVSISAEE